VFLLEYLFGSSLHKIDPFSTNTCQIGAIFTSTSIQLYRKPIGVCTVIIMDREGLVTPTMWQPRRLDHISQRKSPFQSILHQFFSDTQYFYISIDPMVYKRDWRWSYDNIGSEGFVKSNYVKTRTIQSISAGNRSYSRISHSIQVLKSMFFLLRIYYYVRHIMSIKFIMNIGSYSIGNPVFMTTRRPDAISTEFLTYGTFSPSIAFRMPMRFRLRIKCINRNRIYMR